MLGDSGKLVNELLGILARVTREHSAGHLRAYRVIVPVCAFVAESGDKVFKSSEQLLLRSGGLSVIHLETALQNEQSLTQERWARWLGDYENG